LRESPRVRSKINASSRTEPWWLGLARGMPGWTGTCVSSVREPGMPMTGDTDVIEATYV
jgi:hypothetical protein